MANGEALVMAVKRVLENLGSLVVLTPTAQFNSSANLDTFLSLSFPSLSCLTIGLDIYASQDSCEN